MRKQWTPTMGGRGWDYCDITVALLYVDIADEMEAVAPSGGAWRRGVEAAQYIIIEII